MTAQIAFSSQDSAQKKDDSAPELTEAQRKKKVEELSHEIAAWSAELNRRLA